MLATSLYNLALEAPHHQRANEAWLQVLTISYCIRVDQFNQARERGDLAIMRGRGEKQQGICRPGNDAAQCGKSGVAAAVGDMMGLVDNGEIPAETRTIEVRKPLGLCGEVHRDDKPWQRGVEVQV